MGEWDASNSNEPIASQEFTVARIFVHPQYSSSTLSNSIAILRLSSAVPIGQTPTITTGCLSSANIAGLRCWVAGWGATSFTSTPGSAGSIQTHVDVPLSKILKCLKLYVVFTSFASQSINQLARLNCAQRDLEQTLFLTRTVSW